MAGDFRSGTTRRVVAWLRAGHSVSVLGGPLLGKSFLRARAHAAIENPALSFLPLERVLSLGALGDLVPVGAKAVPLGTIPRQHLPGELDDQAWSATVGHPHLLRGWLDGQLEARRQELRQRLVSLREALMPELAALHAVRRVNDPHERYRLLHGEHGLDKARMDRLARLGLIARAIYGDRAGVEVVPALPE